MSSAALTGILRVNFLKTIQELYTWSDEQRFHIQSFKKRYH